MSESDKVFSGSIAELYDACLVPLIFAAYAEDLARRVAAVRPRDVLEVAAGTGVVPRALAPLLDAGARYHVTDLNRPMLDHAMARQGPDPRIAWRQADALALPFADATFDAVCCQFGAMFFPDRVAGYREARRVLRPGGRLVFSVWDRIEANAFADVVTAAAGALFPHDPPRFLARTPHGYHDTAQIEADVRGAGFDMVEIVTRVETSTAPSAREVAVAYCQGTPLRNEILARNPDGLAAATEAAERALVQAYGAGEVSAPISAHVVVARKEGSSFS